MFLDISFVLLENGVGGFQVYFSPRRREGAEGYCSFAASLLQVTIIQPLCGCPRPLPPSRSLDKVGTSVSGAERRVRVWWGVVSPVPNTSPGLFTGNHFVVLKAIVFQSSTQDLAVLLSLSNFNGKVSLTFYRKSEFLLSEYDYRLLKLHLQSQYFQFQKPSMIQ